MAEETLAWRAISPGWKVLDREGGVLGSVSRVLADEGADIFHGIAVRRGLPVVGEEREVLAAQIDRIAEDTVFTSVAAGAVNGLESAP